MEMVDHHVNRGDSAQAGERTNFFFQDLAAGSMWKNEKTRDTIAVVLVAIMYFFDKRPVTPIVRHDSEAQGLLTIL
jgi:hypothetical protein